MMWNKTRLYLIVASLALNVGFVVIWVAHAVPWPASPDKTGQAETQQTVSHRLHRELGVTEEQWARIEPRLREFQAAVGELCEQTDAMRAEVIDLIAAKEPDREAIRAKQDEILATKRRIQGLVAEHLLAEKQILTPDQRAKLFERLRSRAGCAGPPMSGQGKGRLGRVCQDPDEGKK